MKAATKGGGSPPAWLSANSYQCKALVQEPWPVLYVVITERNRTMPFAFPHACSTKIRHGFYHTY